MNATSFLLLLVFVLAGYVLHPIVLPGLKNAGIVSSDETEEVEVTKKPEKEKAGPRDLTKLDLTTVKVADFPSKVTLYEALTLKVPGMEAPIPVAAGSMVVPKELKGEVLVVQDPRFTVTGEIPIEQTDFKKLYLLQADANRKARIVELAANKQPQQAEVVVPSKPLPEVEEVKKLSEAEVIELMKESVRSGKVSEFKFEQVLGWKLEADEQIDGQSYQIGLIVYNAETIFGVQKQRAKALIAKGKVAKWIWAETGVEIR